MNYYLVVNNNRRQAQGIYTDREKSYNVVTVWDIFLYLQKIRRIQKRH